jgi:hypothetical protein
MLDSVVRTFVPIMVGMVLGVAAKVGLGLPSGAVADIVTVVITTGYYALARIIEKQWPAAGQILLSAGLSKRSPVYPKSLGTGRM